MTEIILLHGWAVDSGVWAKQESQLPGVKLIKVNYQKLSTDFPKLEGLSQFASTVLAVIERECNIPPIIAGWSLGSLLALELALLRPEKVAGMVLIGGTSRFTQTDDYHSGLPKVVVERMKKRLHKNAVQTLDGFYSLMFTPGERQAGDEDLFRKLVFTQEQEWELAELSAGLDYLMDCDFRVGLEKIKQPVMILHGDKDEICPPSAAQFLHDNLTSSQLVLATDCGHAPFFSQAELFNNTVKEWLNVHGQISN